MENLIKKYSNKIKECTTKLVVINEEVDELIKNNSNIERLEFYHNEAKMVRQEIILYKEIIDDLKQLTFSKVA